MSDFFDDDEAECAVCNVTGDLMACRKCGVKYICIDCFERVGCGECGYGT